VKKNIIATSPSSVSKLYKNIVHFGKKKPENSINKPFTNNENHPTKPSTIFLVSSVLKNIKKPPAITFKVSKTNKQQLFLNFNHKPHPPSHPPSLWQKKPPDVLPDFPWSRLTTPRIQDLPPSLEEMGSDGFTSHE